jgi:uncharacterized protein (DUF934 family)
VNATALLALECPVFDTDRSRSSFASSMRFRLHFGQRGRSIAEMAAEDTG